jgi:glycosyltransferase involved in cell wall biosynthesis
MKPGRLFSKKPYTERYADAIVQLFKEQRIAPDPKTDIFYSQWLPEAYQAQAAAKRLGIKTSILIIGDDILVYPHASQGNFNTIKTTIEQANGRFAVAKYLGDEANKLLGTSYRFDAIRRGVNYDFFRPASATEIKRYRQEFNIPQDKTVILTVGSPIVRKGWLDLFDALQAVKEKYNDFVFAGAYSGLGEINLDEEVSKRGLKEYFINLGEVLPEKINKLYNTADIFCLPSHWEGIANCVVEAMASGLPVITTNVCGHPEVIRSADTGVLIPPKQPDLLAEKLSYLLGDRSARVQLGENARTFIVNEWGNFNDNAARLYGKLQEILHNK